MKRILSRLVWIAIALLGAGAFSVVALERKEKLSALWILIAAFASYAVAYRFYAKWLAVRLLALDDRRATPAHIHEDGRDFVKTNKWIVLGHHFAAISGPGPLVGPVLAAQFGYLPGALWIPVGVVIGGAVQDFLILVFSMRRNGRSLGEMVKDELGTVAGVLSLVAIVTILIILIAVLGLVVVKALAHSPWGTFTILCTIPIALLMGIYLRVLRPGRVVEVSIIGVLLLLAAVWGGRFFHEQPSLGRFLTFDTQTLAWGIIAYGLFASALPVWLLLAPRDYLSTFMKLGTIAALALGILVVMPRLSLPALSRFTDGTGPVFSGNIFPFCFITIACGAISGFHSLIASGTTPKLIGREQQAVPIGYGSMLLESSVAIMALIAACTLSPGVYFSINGASVSVGSTPEQVVRTVSDWGYPVTLDTMVGLARDVGETTLFGRAGGAPTLAVGMAQIFSQVIGGKQLMSLWYHFAIMFEALFILTTIDAGTRVGRFLTQAFLAQVCRPLGNTSAWGANLFASVLLVAGWGYFLMQGVVDPLGGINSLWPLFGIANQLLSVIALCLATTILLKHGVRRHVWVTLLPLVWVACVTFTAAVQKVFSADPHIGFLAAARAAEARMAAGGMEAGKLTELGRVAQNQRVDAIVALFFLVMVGAVVATSLASWWRITTGRSTKPLSETEPVWLSLEELVEVPSHDLRRGLHGAALVAIGIGPAPLWLATRSERTHVCSGEHAELTMPERREGAEHDDIGKRWADSEERRFSRPRCC